MVLLLTDDQDEVLGGMVTLLFLPRPSISRADPQVSCPLSPSPPQFPQLAALALDSFAFVTPDPLRKFEGPQDSISSFSRVPLPRLF